MKLFSSLNKNLKYLKTRLDSNDICFSEIKVGNKKGIIIFVSDLIDKHALGDLVIKPITSISKKNTTHALLCSVLSPEKQEIDDLDDAMNEVVSGNTLLIVDGIKQAFSFSLKKFEKRAIAEPPTSTVIKGPREGFVENLSVNISLIRRKLLTPDLKIEELSIGKYSKTKVSVCYIKGIADIKLVNIIKQKLKQIKIDAVLDSSYISKFLYEHKTSIFKQVGNTEKPDILTSKILEGRVAILVDGSPIVLTLPYLLLEDFQSPSDYYGSSYSAIMARILRVFAVVISLFLPAMFLSAELFHLQLIPLSFLLTIVNSIKGIPFSPSYEMFFTLIIFEILNEASVRMPRYVGMVVSIVGGLVLGETAVNAGIISAPTLMIVALSGICLYTVPELVQSFSLIRLILLLIAGSLGGYGVLLLAGIMMIYLVSFENYGVPLTAPFSPLIREDLKDGIYKGFLLENNVRPKSLIPKNKERIKIKKVS